MEYLPLVFEAIELKIKKLIYSHRQLKQENNTLQQQKANLENQVGQLQEKVSELEDKINKLKVTKVLAGEDTMKARHQINELLRDIDRCYSLLNR